jgi:hypothetical protein
MAKKALSIAGFIVVAILLALTPALSTIYHEAYPAEQAKRAALAVCARTEPGFNRLFAEERARCYARLLPAPPNEPAVVPRLEQVAEAAR